MIPAILIDDEPLARTILKEYLQDFPQIGIVQECSDGFEGLKAVMQHRPQLIFLDIQMPKINGFEMLELIEEPPAIIFITAFEEYAIRAFEMHAIDYLLKPFGKDRFRKAVEKFLDHPVPAGGTTTRLLNTSALSQQQKERVVVKTSGRIKIIPVEDIHFLEAADDYVKIHTKEGAFLKNRTMAYFSEILDPRQFVRTHRSYIVSISQVARIEPYEKESYLAILKNNGRVPVSRSGYARLKEVLGL